MAITARFVRGSQRLDLVYPYSGLVGFTPPPVNPAYNIASGTSANRTAGGALVSTKYTDRRLAFGVRIQGTSKSQLEGAARRLVYFITANTGESLYFEFKDNDLPDPLWGQFAAPLRYEVITAEASYNRDYLGERLRETMLVVTVSLTVKPFALGAKQRLAAASGGVMESVITADGSSRGLTVAPAGTNKMTNPVFGHATWDNGWISGPAFRSAKNTDERYVLPGTTASAQIYTTHLSSYGYVSSVTAGNTNSHTLSFYAKKVDSSPVTAADVKCYYNTASIATASYRDVGDGWYRVSATFAAVATAVNAGLSLQKTGLMLYVSGFMFEERASLASFFYGDMLGCAWTGTAHASTSTRTDGAVRLPLAEDTLRLVEGSVMMAVRFNVASNFGTTQRLLDTRDASNTTSLILSFSGTGTFQLTDGTNTAESAVQTFEAGDTRIVHATWGASGLRVAVDGGTFATASYTIPTPGTQVFIGSSYVPNFPARGEVLACTTYDRELTQAQVTASYQAAAALIAADQRVDYIPWLWTKDGDNITDNTDNGSTLNNWCVISGVAGNAEADTEYHLDLGGTAVGETATLWLSRLESKDGAGLVGLLTNPTTTAETVTTTETSITSLSDPYIRARYLEGKVVHCIVRLIDAGSNLQARLYLAGAAQAWYSDWLDIDPDASTYHLFRIGAVEIPGGASFRFTDETKLATLVAQFQRTTGSADITPAGVHYLPEPIAKVTAPFAGLLYDYIGLRGQISHMLNSDGELAGLASVVGNTVDLLPGVYNVMLSLIGENGQASATTRLLTYSRVFVYPRWSLI